MAIKRLTVRLNPDKVRDREIISYLETFDRKELRTMNNAVLNAVYGFLKNKAKSEKKETVISDIIPEIRKAISEEFSKIFLPLLGGFMGNNSFGNSDKKEQENVIISDTDDVDMDFLGG